MKAQGNGLPEICASNLLRIARGEVPYDRTRGIDGALIDKPISIDDAITDAESLLETYEPRVSVESADTTTETALPGDFRSLIYITEKEEDEEDEDE